MLKKERENMSKDLFRETSQVRDIIEKDRKSRTEERLCKDKEVFVFEH